MAGVFISYRRQDSQSAAGRLGDELKEGLPEVGIFRDVETIEPGVDFVDAINHALNSCSVLLVVIGPRWSSIADADGRRRLDDPNDYTRLEVATALKREGVRVIPVLVEGATMPVSDDLPEELKPLARRNAIELTDKRWKYDVGELETTLRQVLGLQGQPASIPRSVHRAPWKWVAVAIGLLALVLGLYFGVDNQPPDRTVIMPDVIGMPVDEAMKLLAEAHLTGQPEERQSADMTPGHIESTRPQAQALLSPDSRVILYVATPAPMQMPRLVGRSLRDAELMLKEMRLRLAEPTFVQTESAEPKTVLEQSPPAETAVEPGQEVGLTVSAEMSKASVPNLNGMDLDRAVEMLLAHGLKPGRTVFEPRERQDDAVNHVHRQSPKAELKIERGGKVDLWLWGPTIRLPNVIGYEARKASRTLDSFGLRSRLKYAEIDNVKAGVVIGQSPEGETEQNEGALVVLTIAKARSAGSVTPAITLNPKTIEALKANKVLLKPVVPAR